VGIESEVARAVQEACWSLTDQDRQLVCQETIWRIQAEPTIEQLAQVQAAPGEVPLGLYTQPPPTITIFEGPIRRARVPVASVVEHEIQHRLGEDHSLDVKMVACGLTTAATGWTGSESCPMCRLYSRIAEASALLEDLSTVANQQGMVPPGLGGTIRLAQQRLTEAREILRQHIVVLLPNRHGEIRTLMRCLGRTIHDLEGPLTPRQIATAAGDIRRCRRDAHLLAWTYYLKSR
jgi:hypothetical protein